MERPRHQYYCRRRHNPIDTTDQSPLTIMDDILKYIKQHCRPFFTLRIDLLLTVQKKYTVFIAHLIVFYQRAFLDLLLFVFFILFAQPNYCSK
mmetsp:Transcript_5610/g.10243  ORF Transcript_5610/g.10243 Transcript_5610/m.10243 type:complete len:93 (+) Transcript_5610:116-394(+)